jgi:hypothetical protein
MSDDGPIAFEGLSNVGPDARPARRCAACGGRRPCACDRAERRADQEAERFARAAGDPISSTGRGRVLGGNLERKDRGAPAELARALEDKRAHTLIIRDYREFAEARAKALDVALTVFSAERAMLRRHLPFLNERLDAEAGLTLAAIAKRIGIPRDRVFSLGLEVDVQAVLRLRVGATPVLVGCALCGESALDLAERDATGTRIYCGARCRERAAAIGAAIVAGRTARPQVEADLTKLVTSFCTICAREFRSATRPTPKTCGLECRAEARRRALAARSTKAREAAPQAVLRSGIGESQTPAA